MKIKQLAFPLLLALCAFFIFLHKKCGQTERLAIDSSAQKRTRTITQNPPETEGASVRQRITRNVGRAEFRIKCTQRTAFNELPHQHDEPLISEASGWQELAPPRGGAKQWYRLFVQTSITPSMGAGEVHIGREQTIGFSVKGRFSCVACKSGSELANPPVDGLEGNGFENWSQWQDWPRSVQVTIDENTGEITIRRDRSDSEQPGDTFDSGFRLWTELSFSATDGKVTCSANSKHPFGDISTDRKAEVILTRSK